MIPPTTKQLLLRVTIGSAVILVCAALFLLSAKDSAFAQTVLGDFNIQSQTTIAVTVVTDDGQTIVVPIVLDYSAENRQGYGFIKLDASVPQQPGMTITVEESPYISATMRVAVQTDPRTPIVPVVAQPIATAQPAVTATPVPALVVVAPTPLPTPLPPVVPTALSTPTSAPVPVANQNPGIGADVITGDLKWRVISVDDLGNRLVSDNEFIDDATTGGRFIRVVVEIDNRGTNPASYWTPEMLDSQERTFNEYSEQYFFVPDEQQCLLLTVNPGLSKQCTHIYEVSGDAQGLKIKVTDFGFLFGNEAIIELR